MLLALNLAGWFLFLAAPAAAVFVLAVPATRRGANVSRLAIICTAFVLVATAGHRTVDIFAGAYLFDLFMNVFDVDLNMVGISPGITRAFDKARSAAIIAMCASMVLIVAVLGYGFFVSLRFPVVIRWLYGSDSG